jgi:hypothetical protein
MLACFSPQIKPQRLHLFWKGKLLTSSATHAEVCTTYITPKLAARGQQHVMWLAGLLAWCMLCVSVTCQMLLACTSYELLQLPTLKPVSCLGHKPTLSGVTASCSFQITEPTSVFVAPAVWRSLTARCCGWCVQTIQEMSPMCHLSCGTTWHQLCNSSICQPCCASA